MIALCIVVVPISSLFQRKQSARRKGVNHDYFLNMSNSQCLSLGGKQLIKWQSFDFEVVVKNEYLEKDVDQSVCELEISEVMEEGKQAEKQFVRWQKSSDFEEEEESSTSDSGEDDEVMMHLYMQKMKQAEKLKESSTDLSMGDQNFKAPETGSVEHSQASPRKSMVKVSAAKVVPVVENRNYDGQLVMEDGSTDQLNKSEKPGLFIPVHRDRSVESETNNIGVSPLMCKFVAEEVSVKDQICKWWTGGGKRPAQVEEEAGCIKPAQQVSSGQVGGKRCSKPQVEGEGCSKKSKQFRVEEQELVTSRLVSASTDSKCIFPDLYAI